MSDCSVIKHDRTTPTAAAIWERRIRFRQAISSRAVKDTGIDLKPPKLPPVIIQVEKPAHGDCEPDPIELVASHYVRDYLFVQSKLEQTPRNLIRQVITMIAKAHNLRREDLEGPCRDGRVVLPRHIAMYLIRTHALASYPEIGRMFGNRDHSTVIHAIRKIKKKTAADQVFAQVLSGFELQAVDILNRLTLIAATK